MAQDLLSISREAFQLQLYKMTSQNLIGILYEIYELKWDKGDKMPVDSISDIERKETMINSELMKRGVLSKEHYADYFRMLKKMNYKKKVW